MPVPGAAPGGPDSLLYWFLYALFFMLMLMFLQDLQMFRYRLAVGSFINSMLRKLGEAEGKVVSMLARGGRSVEEVRGVVNRLMNLHVILPVTLEPQGLVAKIKHILSTYNDHVEREIRGLIGDDKPRLKNMSTAIEVLRMINMLYKIVNHYFRLAVKYRNPFFLVQLYVLLPMIRELYSTLGDALDAFLKGVPVGDSAGPLVAHHLINRCGERRMIKLEDTVVAECELEGRRVFIVKAEGPGSTVGRLDDAVRHIVEVMGVKPRIMVTVDAALKFEGEESGTVHEGIGVAMGGIGAERFNIESIAVRHGIPLYAILIKMSEMEAITPMSKQIYEASMRVVNRVIEVVRSNTSPGDTAVVIGVGNTVGVA